MGMIEVNARMTQIMKLDIETSEPYAGGISSWRARYNDTEYGDIWWGFGQTEKDAVDDLLRCWQEDIINIERVDED